MSDFSFTTNQDTGRNDLQIVKGDFLVADDLETAVEMSLFTDKRAEVDELDTYSIGRQSIAPNRGWWADSLRSTELGSTLWLLDRGKQSAATVSAANTYERDALQWLLDEGIVKTLDVSNAFEDDVLISTIKIIRQNDETVIKQYRFVWNDLPLPNDTRVDTSFTPEGNTLLLVHFNGGDGSTNAVDHSRDKPEPAELIMLDNAALTTDRTYFQKPTCAFDGVLSRVTVSREYDFGTGDFTLEAFAYITTGATDFSIFSALDVIVPSNVGLAMSFNFGPDNVGFTLNGTSTFAVAPGGMLDAWSHWRLVRSGTAVVLYINGASAATTTSAVAIDINNSVIGNGALSTGLSLLGNITELRLSDVARNTVAFTPPVKEFSPYKNI